MSARTSSLAPCDRGGGCYTLCELAIVWKAKGILTVCEFEVHSECMNFQFGVANVCVCECCVYVPVCMCVCVSVCVCVCEFEVYAMVSARTGSLAPCDRETVWFLRSEERDSKLSKRGYFWQYSWADRERERGRDRQTDRGRDRQTDRGRETDIRTEREGEIEAERTREREKE